MREEHTVADLQERLARTAAENLELRGMLERGGVLAPDSSPLAAFPPAERQRRRRIRHLLLGAIILVLAGSPFILRSPDPAPDPKLTDVRNASAGYPAFEVQLGSFQYRPNADAMIAQIRGRNVRATMLTTPENLNRVIVRLGPYRTRREAEQVMELALLNGWHSNGRPTIVPARDLSAGRQ